MSSGGYDAPHIPARSSRYIPRQPSGSISASYERPSSPIAVPARRYSYDRPTYPPEYPNVYRPNAPNVYRPEYNAYYRSPSSERYPPPHAMETDDWDPAGSSWRSPPPPPSASWSDRRPAPPISPTVPSPKERVYEREDKRMFEPSNAWKQTHVDRPRIDRSEITPTDLYSGYRNRTSPNNPDDVIAADRPLYRPGTERYRPNSKWEPYTTLARSHYSPYKPKYDPAGSSWPPYASEPGSPPVASYRRDSTAVRTSDHYEAPYASGSVPGSVSPRSWRSPPSKRMRLARSPSRDRPYYSEHSDIELYRNSYDPDVSRRYKARRRSSSHSSIASTNHSENRASNPPLSSQYLEPTLADLGPLGKVIPNDAIANQPILVEAMKSAKATERPTATPAVIKVEDAAKALPERPKFPQGLPAKPVAAIQAANGGTVNGSTVNRSRSASNAQPTPPRQPKSWPSPPPTAKPLAPALTASLATPVSSPSAAPPAPKVPATTTPPSETPATTGVLPTPPVSRVQKEESVPPVTKVDPDAMQVDEPAPAPIKTPSPAPPPANIKTPAAKLHTPTPPPPPETTCRTPAMPPPQPTLEIPKPTQPIQRSTSEALRMAIRTRMLFDHQKRDDRVGPIILVNRRLAPKSETQSTTSPQEVVNEMTSGTPMEVRMKSFSALKPSLVEYFQERQTEITEKVQKLKEEYLSLHERWRNQCASLNEKSRVRNAEAEVAHHMGRTTRRAAALGDAVRSDLEMEQIIASLGYDEATDAHHLSMRNVATIPDMISVTRGKVEYLFDDTSRRVDHPHEYYAPDTGIEDWTQQEREIFVDKYAAFPKQFGIIADHLPHKTAAQCVAFYYLHKKRHINFRQVVAMLAPNKRRRRGTGKKKGNALLADIAQHDAQVLRDAGAGSPASGRLTRGRKPASSRVSAVLQTGATPTATPTPEPDAKPVKRRGRPPGSTNAAIAAAAAAAAAAELAASTVASTAPASRTVSVSREEHEPEIEQDSQMRPKRAKRTRQVKSAAIVPEEADNPTPEPESEQPESISAHGRKPQPSGTQWSEEDKKLFLLLLAQHGDDFKRIAASMPNKTTSQVNNYYKANEEELNLKEIVTSAPKRSLSPSPITEKPPPSSSASQVPPPPTTAISNSTLPDSAPPMGALLPDSPQRKIAPVPPSSAPVASSSYSTMSDKSSRGPATKNVPPPTAPAALRAPSKFPARQRTPPTAPASFLSRNGSNTPNSEPYVYKPPSHFISSTHYRTGTSPPTRPTYQPSSTTSRPYVYPTHYVPQPRIPPGASHSHAHSPYTYGHPTTMPTTNNTQGHYPAYTPNSASRNALPPRNANGRHEPYTYNPGLPHPYYYP